jgi:MioC protein
MTSSTTLHILVGTTTNTAEYVAQAIEMACTDQADHIQVRLMDGLDASVFDEDALYLICTATYGTGDVPDNARGLYESLLLAPRLPAGVRFGVIALGDSVYPQTFCNGGQRFDAALQALGATRVGELLCLDASEDLDPETTATHWCREWLALALSRENH